LNNLKQNEMVASMNETGNIFYDEMMGKLQNMEDALLDVKNGLLDDENINEIFRSIHTLKGTADLLGMLEVVNITHKAEDLLSEVRDHNVELTDELCDLFLELKKFIEVLVDNLLNGIDLTSETTELMITFEEELYKHLPSSQKDIEYKRILVLDESFLIRGLIKKISNDEGYDVTSVADGIDGARKIADHHFDLIIADIDSTQINGYQMLQQIQQIPQKRNIPIVLLVTPQTKDVAKISRDVKSKAWLLKPIKQHKLTELLDKLLK
jgi:chemotaxis protein histidine kinase CheA